MNAKGQGRKGEQYTRDVWIWENEEPSPTITGECLFPSRLRPEEFSCVILQRLSPHITRPTMPRRSKHPFKNRLLARVSPGCVPKALRPSCVGTWGAWPRDTQPVDGWLLHHRWQHLGRHRVPRTGRPDQDDDGPTIPDEERWCGPMVGRGRTRYTSGPEPLGDGTSWCSSSHVYISSDVSTRWD